MVCLWPCSPECLLSLFCDVCVCLSHCGNVTTNVGQASLQFTHCWAQVNCFKTWQQQKVCVTLQSDEKGCLDGKICHFDATIQMFHPFLSSCPCFVTVLKKNCIQHKNVHPTRNASAWLNMSPTEAYAGIQLFQSEQWMEPKTEMMAFATPSCLKP